jgi:1-acyl-sn-glycerol-3-phosphate acyltransferase
MAASTGARRPTTKTSTAKATKATKATTKPAAARTASVTKATGKAAAKRASVPTGSATKAPARSGALAAGAARASGERARRRNTPLIAVSSPAAEPSPAAAPAPERVAAPAPERVAAPPPAPERAAGPERTSTTGKHRPRPVPKDMPTGQAVARSGTRTPKPPRRHRPAPTAAVGAEATTPHTSAKPVRALKAVADTTPDLPPVTPTPDSSARSVAPGVDELLSAGIAAIRVAAQAAGISADDVERHLAAMLSFVRRRVTGDYTVDEFGFDEDFTRHFYLPVLRPLYRSWFRVEVRGIENIPAQGGGLVVANHSGTIAMDSLMTQVAVHDEHPAHRHLRMLGADLVFQTPVVGQLARKSGSTLAANPDAERLLSSGELCGVWPEGFKGVGKPFSERYKLQRFGRGGFVSAALRTGVPIIPCSIVGAEEIYPIIGNMKTIARLVGAPYAPVTPTWPLLGPLGLIPLPSKWIIEFGSPVETADLGPASADDPMLVFDLTDQVRETIQQTLYSLLMQRRSVFF